MTTTGPNNVHLTLQRLHDQAPLAAYPDGFAESTDHLVHSPWDATSSLLLICASTGKLTHAPPGDSTTWSPVIQPLSPFLPSPTSVPNF
ncbi:hypothetical protein DIZ76_010244 [Coccidioides immitis]|nr:hypothetical protein DIZ76_010244 [Coccidioides immitis]